MRKLLLALALLVPTLAVAQAPPPVPALPDAQRLTSFSLTASLCNCSVGFAIYGDGTDVDAWLQVFINGVPYLSTDPTHGWTLTSATGSLGSIPRPITNAVLNFHTAQTGTVLIVGDRRPRRASQFPESRGVTARELNQVITDITAENRELWNKLNSTVRGQPTDSFNPLPGGSTRAGQFLCFDSQGVPAICAPGGSGGGGGPGVTDPFDPTTVGADPTCTTDSAPAFALALIQSSNIRFPRGCYKFLSNLTVNLDPTFGSVRISGAGQNLTKFQFPSGNGIVINYSNASNPPTNSAALDGFVCQTGAVDVGQCILLTAPTPLMPSSDIPPVTTIRDVACWGTDGINKTFVWNSCIKIVNINDIVFDNIVVYGNDGMPPLSNGARAWKGIGINLVGSTGTSTATPSVVYNFSNLQMTGLDTGMIYGNDVQGVAIVNSNFTAVTRGVWTPPGEVAFLGQLSITNSQFAPDIEGDGVRLDTCINAFLFTNNLLIPAANGALQGHGINIVCQEQAIITGNHFVSPSGAIGIQVGPNVASAPILPDPNTLIANNFFYFMQPGITLVNGAQGVQINGNSFLRGGSFVNLAAANSNIVVKNNAGLNPLGPSTGTLDMAMTSGMPYRAGVYPELWYVYQSSNNDLSCNYFGFDVVFNSTNTAPQLFVLEPNQQVTCVWSGTAGQYVKDVH